MRFNFLVTKVPTVPVLRSFLTTFYFDVRKLWHLLVLSDLNAGMVMETYIKYLGKEASDFFVSPFLICADFYSMLNEIPAPEAFRKEKLRVTPLEFEKDDDSNGHIDFIVGTFYLQCTVSVLRIRSTVLYGPGSGFPH